MWSPGAAGAPARGRRAAASPERHPGRHLVKVLPEIDEATELAVEESSALLRAVVGSYLRLIDYQLRRIQLVINKGTDHLTDDPLPEMLQKLTVGRGELAATTQPPSPFLALNQLKINILRFNG